MVKLFRPSYSSYAEDNLRILYYQYFFQTIYDRYLFSIIRPVLFPTLYKFIVWVCWAKTQSCLGSKPKLVLTFTISKLGLQTLVKGHSLDYLCILIFFLATFSCYIPWFEYHLYHAHVNLVLGASSCPISHLLELSTTSCKVTHSLFKYHLHINTARDLAGKHLMWR